MTETVVVSLILERVDEGTWTLGFSVRGRDVPIMDGRGRTAEEAAEDIAARLREAVRPTARL